MAANDIDRLVKRLAHSFNEGALGDSSLRYFLRKQRLSDFVNHDRPETTDPVVMAADAVLYLGVDKTKAWHEVFFVFQCALAFLNGEGLGQPKKSMHTELKEIMLSSVVDEERVRNWFANAFSGE